MTKEEEDKAARTAAPGPPGEIPADQLAAWKQQYGEVIVVPAAGRTFVFRKPAWADVSRFIDGCVAGTAGEANLNLVVDTLLSPSAEAFGQLMAENPLLPIVLGTKVQGIMEVAGVGKAKKL